MCHNQVLFHEYYLGYVFVVVLLVYNIYPIATENTWILVTGGSLESHNLSFQVHIITDRHSMHAYTHTHPSIKVLLDTFSKHQNLSGHIYFLWILLPLCPFCPLIWTWNLPDVMIYFIFYRKWSYLGHYHLARAIFVPLGDKVMLFPFFLVE